MQQIMAIPGIENKWQDEEIDKMILEKINNL